MAIAPIAGIAVFAALILFDLIAHKRMKLGRRLTDWIFLCAFVFGLVFSVVTYMFPLMKTGTVSDTSRYIAYRYLMDGESGFARNAVNQDAEGKSKSADIIDILSYAVEGDYEETYYRTNEYIGTNILTPKESENAYELLEITKNALESGEDLSSNVMQTVEKCFSTSGIRETDALKTYYDLHKRISLREEGIESSEISGAIAEFPYEQSVKKAAVTWYVNEGLFDEAESTARALLEEEKSEANRIIYTDVIAQRAALESSSGLAASTDPEISALVLKADSLVQRALADESRYDAFMHEADEAYTAARTEMLKRVKNYIRVNIPAAGDDTGVYDLQLIKMDLLMGDYDSALKNFNTLLEKAPDISASSPVYSELMNIAAETNSYLTADEASKEEAYERLQAEMHKLFLAQSQGVVDAPEGGLNTKAASVLLALLKYSRPEMVITRIDTSAYPKLKVAYEMNIGRKSLFGRDGEFYKDDFRLTDTGLEIAWDDITLTTAVGSRDTAICVVVDISNTEGTVKQEATAALLKLVDGTAKRAVVASDGTVLCGFDDTNGFYTAARELGNGASGDSYTALMSGISLFEGRTNAAKCLLWITDKNELDTSLRQDIIDGALKYGINLYIMYVGDEDPSMYKSLAASASGAVFGLDSPSEMAACACEIVDLLDNRYEVTYRVANISATQRSVTIEIPDRSLVGNMAYTPEVTG